MNTAEIVNLSAWTVYLTGAGWTAKSRFARKRAETITKHLDGLTSKGHKLSPELVKVVTDNYEQFDQGDHKLSSFFFGAGWFFMRPITWLFENPKPTKVEQWAANERVERDRDAELADLQRKIDDLARQAKR